jgi:hypothetical protein
MFTGLWTGLVGLAVVQSDVLHPAFGIIGLIQTPLFVMGAMEFVGSSRLGVGSLPANSFRSHMSAGLFGCWPRVPPSRPSL